MKSRTLLNNRVIPLLVGAVLLQACSSDNDAVAPAVTPPPPPPAMASFNVTVTNLTNAQPLSPIALIAHADGYSTFSVGSPATAGLELLSEEGDNSSLLAEAAADAVVITTETGAAPIGPAGSDTLTVQVLESQRPGLQLSVSTMLVNTNDAFTGLNALDVDSLEVGDSISVDRIAYDAGTEADTEEAIHIPGPAGGGEGFNAARDDQADQVSMHSGVVTQDDGFATSDLTEQHRFDNPVARIRIERIN